MHSENNKELEVNETEVSNTDTLKEESNSNLSKSYIDEKFNDFKVEMNSMFVDEFSKLIKKINSPVASNVIPSKSQNDTLNPIKKEENNFDF